jgi:hypothetical protein
MAEIQASAMIFKTDIRNWDLIGVATGSFRPQADINALNNERAYQSLNCRI